MSENYDAVVVGAGPNGLAAAITLAQAGLSVLLVEANAEIGGACRSAELTLPGFVHDTGSAIHPLAMASPFFKTLPLARLGLKWIQPEIALAHPLDGGRCVQLHRSIAEQVKELGADGERYRKMIEPFLADADEVIEEILQPLWHMPKSPLLMMRFGMRGLASAANVARGFQTEEAKAFFGGLAAHSFLPMEQTFSSAIGLVLGVLGHAVGWPMPQGGAGQITRALGEYFQELGGSIETNRRIVRLEELHKSRVVILDLTARQVVKLAGERLPNGYRRRLENFRYGAAAFKVDYALSSPVPWRNAACVRAGTVHLGGTFPQIAESERLTNQGDLPKRPFVLVAQHSLFDATRAPAGKHTLWTYGHVPHGCAVDATRAIEEQIERFAPGFRDCVLARCVRGPAMLESGDANLVGGDINGGAANLAQMIARPVMGPDPYRTPVKGLYLCSSSTPPGGGVHGMCGRNAALNCLKREFGISNLKVGGRER